MAYGPPRVDASQAKGLIIGDHATLNATFHAPSTPISWPLRVGVVPPLADCLQHRHVQDEAFVHGDSTTVVLTQVLSGMGGVGKTQLAAEYAERMWSSQTDSVQLLVWISAQSRTSIISFYAEAAARLGLAHTASGEQAASRLLAWLASTDRRWLIVLDDVASPADLRGLWPPNTGNGCTVVTTRRRDAALSAIGRRLVSVGLFTMDEAREFVDHKLAAAPHLADDIDALIDDLDALPLALAQATSYMIDQEVSCTRYRKRWTDRRVRLKALLPDPSAAPDDYQTAVGVTWSLSVEQADCLEPVGAAGLLSKVAALLDPHGVPAAVFTAPSVLAWLQSETGRAMDGDDVHDGLRNLHRFSLATHDPTNAARCLRVHAFVQRATTEQMPEQQRNAAAVAIADALKEIWPRVESDTELGQALRANTAALRTAEPDALWTNTGGHAVLFRAGKSLGEAGQVVAALSYFRQLHETALQRLGTDHPDTLTTRHDVADWQGVAGNAAGAVAALQELLADTLRILGPDDPSARIVRHNLAYWLGEAGEAVGATAAFEEMLADRLRVLGPDHRDTLTVRHNLAYWRGKAGDAAGAAAALQELLADALRVLGADHRDTLTVRHNLARWRGESGDTAGAVAALQEVLADRLRVLGPDHPSTLAVRHNLARWRGESGDAAGAAAALQELLVDALRVLGPDHPSTPSIRHNLARWQGEAGDAARSDVP